MCAQCAIYGNFSAPKVQELVVSRGKVLELLRPDEQGKVQVIYSTDVFGVIRSLQPFRCGRAYVYVGVGGQTAADRLWMFTPGWYGGGERGGGEGACRAVE